MVNTVTTRYDVAEHLRSPEEMAAYLEACMEEAHGDPAFVPGPWAISPGPRAYLRWRVMQVFLEKVFKRRPRFEAARKSSHDG
jgi:hypothetical protein